MANLTEYDVTGLGSSGIVGALQTINTMANGYLGISMLLAISMIVFSILVFFGDSKAAFYGSSFTAFGIGLVFLAMELLTPPLFFIMVMVNLIIVVMISKK